MVAFCQLCIIKEIDDDDDRYHVVVCDICSDTVVKSVMLFCIGCLTSTLAASL